MSLAAASVVQAPGHDAGSTTFLQESPLLWIVYLLFSKAEKTMCVCHFCATDLVADTKPNPTLPVCR